MEKEHSQGDRRPWGGWATAGLTAVIMAMFFISQVFVVIVDTGVKVATDPSRDIQQVVEAATDDGTMVSIAAILSSIVCVGVALIFIWLRRGPSVKAYLAIRPVEKMKFLGYLGIGLLVVAVADLIAFALGRPVVPEFMVSAYSTVAFKPVFWMAVCLVSPVFEEVVFRGFVLTGIQQTRIGAAGAVLVASLLWTLIHLQYGLYDLAHVFILGLILGAVRIKSGSTLPAIGMHALINVVATMETALVLGLQVGGS